MRRVALLALAALPLAACVPNIVRDDQGRIVNGKAPIAVVLPDNSGAEPPIGCDGCEPPVITPGNPATPDNPIAPDPGAIIDSSSVTLNGCVATFTNGTGAAALLSATKGVMMEQVVRTTVAPGASVSFAIPVAERVQVYVNNGALVELFATAC